PAGHARVTQTDAAGRLTAVWEDPGSSPHFNYETTYQYDALNDLTQVNQGSETRAFGFDGLGRLQSGSNPESGTLSYTYDSVGNLLTKTDTRNIKTSYTYDALNRVTQKTYSDGTPAVGYQYDASGAGYSWGHLTAEWNGNSTTQYASIDPLGRVTASNQQTAGEWYGFTYYYNLAGALTYETYPSGRGVTTSYNASNQATGVTGNYNGFTTNYVSGAWYWPHGAENNYTFGNSVWRVFTYNNRLQPSGLWDAINNDSRYFLFLENPIGYGANNNGNVQSLILYASAPGQPGVLTSYTENFTYDNLNRLTSATDTGGWSRSFAYDQYGNGWVTAAPGMGYSLSTPNGNIFNGKNQIGSSPYDAAGNMLALPPGMTFAYDAENRQTSETNSGGLSATYAYDGEGKRVEKILSNGQKVLYVYDALGRLAAEYDLQNPGTPPCATCYLTYDHLGTLRMVTDANANVVARHDYIPFGEEIPSGIAGRNSQFDGYDNVNQKFTGKERDTETSLDFFQARYYGAGMGRFMSVDFGGPIPDRPDPVPWADLENPQSLNLYAYGLNNPLANVDDDGHDVNVCTSDENGDQQCVQMSNEQYQQAQQGNNIGLNLPTLNQLGMNGDGSGNFNATNITDSNGNVVGIATYVSNGGADYYANRNGVDMLTTTARTMDDPRTYALWLGASATAGYGLYAAGAFEGGLTTLGIGAETGSGVAPTAGQAAQAERVLAENGRKSVERAIRTLEKRIAEHEAKIQSATGHTSSMDREVQNFRRLLQAYKDVLGK
ncbi:MAG: RHS repeat protein, partial [Acidobacteriaceae bacterium]|nr:RHS repeat protein [Acidobacteriaceae bacterium]